VFEDVLTRIEAACSRSGRKPEDVKLVAVTKGKSISEISRAILRHHHRILGENRVQEWREKAPHLDEVEWHFIGSLQRNKVKYCTDFFLIHSLNSTRLADALQQHGTRRGHVFQTLVEVNVAGELSKQGASLTEAEALVDYARNLSQVTVQGLMTIAPYSKTPEDARRYFEILRNLRDKLALKELSIGMSGDFEVAIEEGATIVRVGSALFT
jgi:pyridoxal phosphate enzyme (YggS family)